MDNDDLDEVTGRVGARLKELRNRRGLRLADLSERTGISVTILSRLESGLRSPSLDILLKIARAYHVPLDDLVGAPPTGDPGCTPSQSAATG